MRIHTYIVQHDKGFAPNPFWNVCTLACCKPRIRERVDEGDVIIGFGSASKEVGLGGHVVYWMKVQKIISFDEYWQDPDFAVKRPVAGAGLMAWYGDNIYHRDAVTAEWVQAFSFHSDGKGLGRGNLHRDTHRTERVLIGYEYAYWGGAGPEFPEHLKHLMPSYQAERCHYNDEEKKAILDWLNTLPDRGYCSEPADWVRDHAKAPNRHSDAPAEKAAEAIAC